MILFDTIKAPTGQEHLVQTIKIENDGPLLRATDYWGAEPAGRGLMLLCGNAGALRLLVPPTAEHYLAEMRTGTRVTIERSMEADRAVDVVFEDGTPEPFYIALHERQLISTTGGARKQVPFYVYTAEGIALRFVARDAR